MGNPEIVNKSEIVGSSKSENKNQKQCNNVLDYISGQPWLATEIAVSTVLTIAERYGDPESVAAKLGRRPDNTKRSEIREGIGILDVNGTIFRYASIFHDISGGTSIQILAKDFNVLLENEDVKAIVLNIDSPGGQVNGISEFAEMVFAARKIKPIIAYVGGQGASGAYWIASAASKIVISDTAILGSIGTVVQIVDTTERDKKAGVRVFDIVSRKSPFKRSDPNTEQGKEQILKTLDSITDVFISTVAKFRGVSTEKVETDFGRGGIFVGEENTEQGLADEIGSFENTIKTLSKKFNSGDFQMENNNTTEIKKEDNADVEISIESIKAIYPQIASALRKEGADIERERIKGVEEKLMIGHEALITELKYDGSTTPEMAASKIIEAEKKAVEQKKEDLKSDAADVPAVDSELDNPNAVDAKEDRAVKNMLAGADTK